MTQVKLETAGRPRVSRRVLVVEDNLEAVHTLAFLLQNMGHKVEYAINGYVAVDIARSFRPDFVLLDLALPGLDGFEVCRRLKAMAGLENSRIVAITGNTTDEARERSRAAGCDLHLVKPVSPREIFELLES